MPGNARLPTVFQRRQTTAHSMSERTCATLVVSVLKIKPLQALIMGPLKNYQPVPQI